MVKGECSKNLQIDLATYFLFFSLINIWSTLNTIFFIVAQKKLLCCQYALQLGFFFLKKKIESLIGKLLFLEFCAGNIGRMEDAL